MAQIPSTINGVSVEFGSGIGNDVDQRVIEALRHCIKSNVAPGHVLTTIYISSPYDSHQLPSRHMHHKAVDISRINGTKIVIGYPQGGSIKAIVDAIQDAFETFAFRRENFGPHVKKKLGQDFFVSGHDDHIHLSVN
jgi:hypothetical protein